jgi:hypothetical protein
LFYDKILAGHTPKYMAKNPRKENLQFRRLIIGISKLSEDIELYYDKKDVLKKEHEKIANENSDFQRQSNNFTYWYW